MTELNADTFNQWYETLDGKQYHHGPEDMLPRPEIDGDEPSPWGWPEEVVNERDRDYPSNWLYVVKVGDKHFRKTGYYDSYDSVDWEYAGTEWEEVVEKTRTETYWETV